MSRHIAAICTRRPDPSAEYSANEMDASPGASAVRGNTASSHRVGLRPFLVLICAGLLAAGCMATGTEAPDEFVPVFETPTLPSEASPTSSSSLTVPEAAELFLACADPYNVESARLLREEQQSSTFDELVSVATSRSANDGAFASCLSQIDWPTAVESDARDLIDTVLALEAIEELMASATTLDELRSYEGDWDDAAADVAAAAEALREALGLPPG